MYNSDFYRHRAQVARKLATYCHDETAKQMMQKAAERWRELAELAKRRNTTRRRLPRTTKKGRSR